MEKLQANHPLDWQFLDLFFYFNLSEIDLEAIKQKLQDSSKADEYNCILYARSKKFDTLLFNKACTILAAYFVFGPTLESGDIKLTFD